jgi:predicted nucleic acid-binding protein
VTTPALQRGLLVLDTLVASEKFRGTFDEARYGHIFNDKTEGLPLPAVAELLQLPLRHNWGQGRTQDLHEFIDGFTILNPSRATADWWATIRAECARVGIAAGENHTWIAAAAAELGYEPVSYDRDHQRMSSAVSQLSVIWLEHSTIPR